MTKSACILNDLIMVVFMNKKKRGDNDLINLIFAVYMFFFKVVAVVHMYAFEYRKIKY